MYKPYKVREETPEFAIGIVLGFIVLIAMIWMVCEPFQGNTRQEMMADINVSEANYIETNSDVYYVEFEVCNQDNVNETSFVVQVSKTYFDSVEVGDIVSEGFRIKAKGIE